MESKVSSGQWKHHPDFPSREDFWRLADFNLAYMFRMWTCSFGIERGPFCGNRFQDKIMVLVFDEEAHIDESEDEKEDAAQHDNKDSETAGSSSDGEEQQSAKNMSRVCQYWSMEWS